MSNFFHLTIIPAELDILHALMDPTDAQMRASLEAELDSGFDWLNYTQNCYVIYSSKTAASWSHIIRGALSERVSFFICKIDMTQRQGWMAKSFWDWMKTARERNTFRIGDNVFVWNPDRPGKVYTGMVIDFLAPNKPRIYIDTNDPLGLKTKLVYSKTHPATKNRKVQKYVMEITSENDVPPPITERAD